MGWIGFLPSVESSRSKVPFTVGKISTYQCMHVSSLASAKEGPSSVTCPILQQRNCQGQAYQTHTGYIATSSSDKDNNTWEFLFTTIESLRKEATCQMQGNCRVSSLGIDGHDPNCVPTTRQ